MGFKNAFRGSPRGIILYKILGRTDGARYQSQALSGDKNQFWNGIGNRHLEFGRSAFPVLHVRPHVCRSVRSPQSGRGIQVRNCFAPVGTRPCTSAHDILVCR